MSNSKLVYWIICILIVSVLSVVAVDENPDITQDMSYLENGPALEMSYTNSVGSINDIPNIKNSTSLTKINHTGIRYDAVRSVQVDSKNNILTGGWIEGGGIIYGYISKLKPDSEIEWTYFLEHSRVGGVAIDSQDNIIITGMTWSLYLPTTPGAFDRTHNAPPPYPLGDEGDLYIAKLNSSGSIVWCTYLGGSGEESGEVVEIIVDSQDNIIIADRTNSADFPTKNAIQVNKSSEWEGFISKFNSSGGLLWSTFLGGSGRDQLEALALDQEDNIYVTGRTESSDFPVTGNAYQKQLKGDFDGFFTKFNPQGNIIWSTFVGGSDFDTISGNVVDNFNNIYLVGNTESSDFPAENDHKGNNDIILCKFNEQGNLIWSKFVGGSDDESALAADIDRSGNVIIASQTLSTDVDTKDAHFEEHSGGRDGLLLSYSPSGELLWSTFFGGFENDFCFGVTIDSQNRIIMGGSTHWPITIDPMRRSFPLINAFQYSFDNVQDGYIAKWENNGSLVWSTLVTVIPYPDADNDNDGLTNYEEYKICYTSSLTICPNPLDRDTDNDRLDDGYELVIGSNPVDQDTDGDIIPDGWEVWLGTLPNDTDSDGDNMDDHWELINFLNITAPDANIDYDHDGLSNYQEYQYDKRLNPHNDDTDNDTMADGWEVENGLDPLQDDRNLDNDKDGLSNLAEYQKRLNPNDPDTDGDGMPDGWEVDHGLVPLENDDFEDADGDGLDNMSEYQLRRLGFKPNSETDVYVAITLIFVTIGSIIGYFLWRRKRNVDAKLMGYESYPDYKTSRKRGFTSAKERSNAFSRGFLSKQVQNAVNSSGYPNLTEMRTDWDNIITRTTDEISTDKVNKHVQQINETTSPLHLEEVKHNLDPFVKKLNQEMDLLRQIISLQQLLISMQENSKLSLLESLNLEELNGYLTKFLSLANDLDQQHITITNAINLRETWFKPWKALLTLIQITEDGMPISLGRVAEVVSC
ncbi:MAG: SBBP repeat-containing protein, partial [Candidatus Kariarchaeaceae archaeon]